MGQQKTTGDYRDGVVRLGHSVIWLVVCSWVLAATIYGLFMDMPLVDIGFNVLAGAMVFFVVGSILSAIGVNLVLLSIRSERTRRVGRMTEEYSRIISEKIERAETRPSGESGGGEA